MSKQLIEERRKIRERLDFINVRCEARNRLEAELHRINDRIAVEAKIERLAR